MHTVRVFMLLLSSLLTAACAAPPGGERPVFGESVRHMIEVQTYASGDDVLPLRGDRAAAAMDAYRRDAANPERFGKGKMDMQMGLE